MQPTNIYVYPVDPTKHYLNKFYNKNYSDFRNDLEEFNRSIISEIKSLSEEFGYRTSSSFKTENKRGFVFRNKKSDLIPYCFSAQYPNSCLGFGLYSYSRILGRLEYRELGYDKYPKYSVQQTGKEFEMFFNIQKNTTVNKIKFDNFNKYFKCDFLDVYKKELNYLSDQQKIKIKDKLLLINTDSSREIYKVMLHFLSLDQLKILKFNLIGQNSNNIELPLKT